MPYSTLEKSFYYWLVKLLCGCCVGALVLSGCRVVYSPTMQHVPLLQEKGDLQLVANANNLQTAYSFSDHFALMANGSYHHNKWEISGANVPEHYYSKNYRYNAEAAIGYYEPLLEKVRMEIFGGGGFGQVNLHSYPFMSPWGADPDQQGLYIAKTRKAFIQPAIGLTDKVIDISFSSRLVAMQFHSIQTSYTEQQMQYHNLFNLDQHTYLFLEPCITARIGFKWLKLQTQFIHSAKLNRHKLNYNPYVLNFSLQFNLSKQHRQQLFR